MLCVLSCQRTSQWLMEQDRANLKLVESSCGSLLRSQAGCYASLGSSWSPSWRPWLNCWRRTTPMWATILRNWNTCFSVCFCILAVSYITNISGLFQGEALETVTTAAVCLFSTQTQLADQVPPLGHLPRILAALNHKNNAVPKSSIRLIHVLSDNEVRNKSTVYIFDLLMLVLKG